MILSISLRSLGDLPAPPPSSEAQAPVEDCRHKGPANLPSPPGQRHLSLVVPKLSFSCLPWWPEVSLPPLAVLPTLKLVAPAGDLAGRSLCLSWAGSAARQAHRLNERRQECAVAVLSFLQAEQG